MQLYNDTKACFGCGACAAACPQQAVSMRRDREGFLYPAVDDSLCVGCGRCEAVCPAREPPAPEEGLFFAVRCRDLDLLRQSSSGGAFSLLAGEMLRRGGLVCGARFDEKFRVKHELSGDIAPMRKSKYVQSDMTACFVPIREALDAGRPVLFSGTPCQCHALERFLGGRRENLLLAALICRGAASPELWEDYVAWLERDGGLERYDFRDKRRQDDGHTVAWTVAGTETAVPMGRDRYSRLYNRCLTYRPSCYACPYCSPELPFDFTIGDFWGVEKVYPELADGLGTSLVIARGERALEWLKAVEAQADIRPCKRQEALQPALEAPAKATLLRKLLFQDLARKGAGGRCDIELLLKKYSGPQP